MQPQILLTEKQRKQQEHWEAVKAQGRVSYVSKTIVILLCAYELGWLTWGYVYKRGWSHTPARFSMRDIIVDVMVGLIAGLYEWSSMERKFEPRDPKKDQTII